MRDPHRPRPITLVTGASAGIGLELARVFAADGFDLVVVARREARLAELAAELEAAHDVRVRVVAMDLLDAEAPHRLFDALRTDGVAIEVLVNDAGALEMGTFREIRLEDHLRLVRLNVATLTALTHLFLDPMVARGSGRILNVASTASFQPVPGLAVYAATKAYVLSLTESLSEELRGAGVTVTALCPGLTRTDMVSHARESHGGAFPPDFLLADARQVAREGHAACMRGQVIAVPGVANRLLASLAGTYPRWLVRAVGGAVSRRML